MSEPAARTALKSVQTAFRKRTSDFDRLSESDAALAEAMTVARDAGATWAQIAEIAQVVAAGRDVANKGDLAPATAMWHSRKIAAIEAAKGVEREVHPDTKEYLTLTEAAFELGLEPAQLRARLRSPKNPVHRRVIQHPDCWYKNRQVTKYEVLPDSDVAE